MRKIEEKLFRALVKSEVELVYGPWTGTVEQNRSADMKISMIVKSSFKVYEKTRKTFEPSYFKF